MKLASFRHAGRATYGIVTSDGVYDVGTMLASTHPTLASLLADDARVSASRACAGRDPLPLETIEWLPPIPAPEKILCIGLNYEEHRLETGRARAEYPAVFTRFADTQMGHESAAWRPHESTQFDYEGELAVIIGRGGRRIAKADALDHVAGYACYNDISVRDWQRHTHQFGPGKNFPRTGAFGPWLVTPDEAGDWRELELATTLNGREMQRVRAGEMIFDVPTLVAYCSTFTPLRAGDVIVTGTPGGVGFKRDPQVFMAPGDVVTVSITRLGTLRTTIEAEPR